VWRFWRQSSFSNKKFNDKFQRRFWREIPWVCRCDSVIRAISLFRIVPLSPRILSLYLLPQYGRYLYTTFQSVSQAVASIDVAP